MRSRLLGMGVPLATTCLLLACDVPVSPPRPKPEAQTPAARPPEPQPAPTGPEPPAPAPLVDGSVAPPAGPKPPRPPLPAEPAPNASPRLDGLPPVEQLRTKIDSYFQGHAGRRIHVQTDKPLYKPGETIWVKVWDLTTRAFAGSGKSPGMHVELLSPRGAPVAKKKLREQQGMSQVDFELGAGLAGGEYTLRVRTLDGQRAERPVVVSSYEAPRLKMKMEFVRKAYGVGDEVTATIEVKRPTGEPLRNQTLTAMVRLDGADLPKVQLTTDAQGEGLVRFNLPAEIALGDGLLTVLCDEGGLTESIARRVPIVLKKLALTAYPEGGELVAGLPGRVYFEAKNPLGKPADVSGHVLDDTGTEVARFTSVRDGLGRFDLTPQPGRSYRIAVDKPVGITDFYPVPQAAPDGCVLRSIDDLDGQLSATRVSVSCTSPRKVVVSAVVRENILDAAAVEVPAGAPAVVYLEPRGQASGMLGTIQGVARVTLFDESLSPMAERLVYRQRRNRLGVKITPDKKTYVPRDKVQLEVVTTDNRGNPVPADLALSVVDDTVLSFADDKTGHMLSRMYLEPELPGKVEEPNFYFDLSEEKSAMAMDLLMGTRGYRRFEWMPGLLPPRPNRYIAARTGASGSGQAQKASEGRPEKAKVKDAGLDDDTKLLAKNENKPQEAQAVRHRAPRPMADPLAMAPRDEAMPEKKAKKEMASDEPPPPPKAARMAMGPMPTTPARPAAAPMAAQAAPVQVAPPAPAAEMAMAEKPRAHAEERAADKADRDDAVAGLGRAAKMPMGAKPMNGAGAVVGVDGLVIPDGRPMPLPVVRPVVRRKPPEAWSVVRVFPTPAYQPGYSGPRNDFRETIAWQPTVQTGGDGKTTVSFFLSDAVSSFRVVTEGVGAGAAGRDETVVKSSLPFSLAVKLPLEVSEGDHIKLPLVLSNEYSQPMMVKLDARFGGLVSLDKPVERTSGELGPSMRETLYYPLTVTGKRGATEVRFAADAAGLHDEVVREIQVSPRGFPQHISKSGRLRESWSQELALAAALPGTADGQVRVYPSLVSNLVASLEGMLREPVGCFEQASSANYPNIMILKALREEGISDPRLTGRAYKLLDEGYRRLSGYETPLRGYEWFGAAPGHEALSAYGLLEFTDMRAVYHDVDRQMITRTADWLMSRRDGKGGYLRDSKAIDSFGSAAKAVTDAYITYSLTEAKQPGLGPELETASYLAQNTNDAYLLALSAGALLNSGRRGAGQAAARRLVAMQESDGAFKKADHSITRSGGESLHIETTSLAILAMLKAGGNDAPVDRAVEWLLGHRRGMGAFGSTQATVLGLKALVSYMGAQGRERQGGSVVLSINGRLIATRPYDVGAREPLVFSGLSQYLQAGANRIELRHTGRLALPFSVAVDYRSLQPATSAQAPVDISTTLERASMHMGESVRMRVVLTNKTDRGQPMTLARVQLPGGLTFQNWQLKELREKGLVAFYETRPREVNLYLREMKPRQQVEIPLDLVAYAAGDYTAQASNAYLYYTDEHKTWVPGTQIAIEP